MTKQKSSVDYGTSIGIILLILFPLCLQELCILCYNIVLCNLFPKKQKVGGKLTVEGFTYELHIEL